LFSKSALQAPRLIRWLGALALLFLVVMTLLRCATHLAFTSERVTGSQLFAALWLGVRFDARVVATGLLPLLVLGSVPRLNPYRSDGARRAWLGLLTVAGGALAVCYAADFLHFRYLGQRLGATALAFLEEGRISAAMVWQSYPVLRIVLGLSLATWALAVAMGWLQRRIPESTNPARRAVSAGWFTFTLLACLVAIFGRLSQYPLRWSDAFALRDAASAQLALNPVESLVSSLDFRTTSFDRAQVEAHYARVSAYLGVTTPDAGRLAFDRFVPARPETSPRRPNVVLVLCESFSGYKSSMWGNPLDTTPFFASLAQQGLFFDNCFTPHFGTARGVWATVTGTPDVSPTETASRNPAMVDQHTLVDEFAGYERLYFLGGSSSWANIRGVLANNIRGLRLHEEDSYRSPRVDVWGISDKDLFLEANEVLRTQTKPFFAIIQTAGNHRPYTIPARDLAEFKPVNLPEATFRQQGFESLAELNAFRYTDYAFRKFIEAARQAPYFDNTLFVFVGDHGIGGTAGAPFPPAWTEQHLTRYHVPLLFYAPKFVPAQRVHSVASMVDILPTIAGLANVPYRNRTFGRDLRRQQELDGGASNVAFVIDHNDKTIGVVRQHYYGLQRFGGRLETAWADFAGAPTAGGASEADRAELEALAHGFYETARYLLLNNPKSAASAPGGLADASPR
jgi:phosphoglycerol transferase MdoB-like AlkP superfamily enzyme